MRCRGPAIPVGHSDGFCPVRGGCAGVCRDCSAAPELCLCNVVFSPDSSVPNTLLSPKLCSSAPCGRLGIFPAARGAAGEEES